MQTSSPIARIHQMVAAVEYHANSLGGLRDVLKRRRDGSDALRDAARDAQARLIAAAASLERLEAAMLAEFGGYLDLAVEDEDEQPDLSMDDNPAA